MNSRLYNLSAMFINMIQSLFSYYKNKSKNKTLTKLTLAFFVLFIEQI